MDLEELTGDRTTVIRPVAGGDEVTIEDTVDQQKTLQDRWTGETFFELVSETQRAPKRLRVRREKGEKRKAEEEIEEPSDRPGPSQPSSMATDLNEALTTVGPNVLDGTPLRGESTANGCPVPECDLPKDMMGITKTEMGTHSCMMSTRARRRQLRQTMVVNHRAVHHLRLRRG